MLGVGTYTWYGVIFLAPRLRVSLTVSSTMLAMNSSSAFADSNDRIADCGQHHSGFSKAFYTEARGVAANDLQINTGVACATLPTSSSACMIFLMRATGNLHCAERLTILRWSECEEECVVACDARVWSAVSKRVETRECVSVQQVERVSAVEMRRCQNCSGRENRSVAHQHHGALNAS